MNLEEIDKLKFMISSKKWDAFDDVRPDKKKILDVLLSFLADLDRVEREFVTDILDNYLLIKEYQREVITILGEIVRRSKGRRVIISAVKDFNADKVKSGTALTFEFNSAANYFPDHEFVFAEDPTSDRFQKAKGFKVLVDDFIGSGNQFLEMKGVIENKGLSAAVDLVAAIVIQREGKQALINAGYDVFSIHERPKSIEALIAKSGKNAQDVYDVYDGIEARTNCSEKYKRGYEQSEATVTLKKTPNNTLPIFWYEGKYKWPAPFPRPKS